MLIQACLNGFREPGSHPALPLTAAELAADARRVVEAGANDLHIHPRDRDGVQTLDPGACDEAVLAIRRACPTVPVGLSTAAWIEPWQSRRLDLVAGWTERPDHASANFSEQGVMELCDLLLRLGIGIEAGVSSPADAESLVGSGLGRHVLRVLIEPGDVEAAAARATATAIAAVLDHAGVEAPRLYHGLGIATWSMIELGLEGGWDVRAGLEDTLELANGAATTGNLELVEATVRAARDRGRLPMASAEPPAGL